MFALILIKCRHSQITNFRWSNKEQNTFFIKLVFAFLFPLFFQFFHLILRTLYINIRTIFKYTVEYLMNYPKRSRIFIKEEKTFYHTQKVQYTTYKQYNKQLNQILLVIHSHIHKPYTTQKPIRNTLYILKSRPMDHLRVLPQVAMK